MTVNGAGPEPEKGEEVTFDGYQAIQSAASDDEDIQTTMREARMKNRISEDKKDTLSSLDLPVLKTRKAQEPEPAETVESRKAPDLSEVYANIQKQKEGVTREMNEATPDERPDPGYRIYHVDENGTRREVPPYTLPGDFLKSLESSTLQSGNSNQRSAETQEEVHNIVGSKTQAEASDGSGYNEKTYDGYQDIIKANASTSREDELRAMREARQRNRIGRETLNGEQQGLFL